MHSIIRAFPSFHFYENKLEDHKSVMDRENIEHYPEFNVFNILQYYFSRFVFYDLSYSEES
jgi:superfamily I DNA and/or RNA helicase